MEYSNREVAVDIERGEAHNGSVSDKNPRKNKSLQKLVGGLLNGLSKDRNSQETTHLLAADQEHLLPLVNKCNDNEKEDQKLGKSNKSGNGKPPRHPKSPTLDACDVRFIKEISKIAARKKRESIKAPKKTKATEAPSPLPSSQLSSSTSSVCTISAMIITLLFFLMIVFQGFCPNNSSFKTVVASEPIAAADMISFPPLNV